jgi:hypothetical protein
MFEGGPKGKTTDVWRTKRELLSLVRSVVATQHGTLGAAEAGGFAIPFFSPAGAFVIRGSANAIEYLRSAIPFVDPIIAAEVARDEGSCLRSMRQVRVRAAAGSIAQVFRAMLPEHLAQLHKEVREATGLQEEEEGGGDEGERYRSSKGGKKKAGKKRQRG